MYFSGRVGGAGLLICCKGGYDDDEDDDDDGEEEELCILAGEGGGGERAAAGRRGQDMVATLPARVAAHGTARSCILYLYFTFCIYVVDFSTGYGRTLCTTLHDFCVFQHF